MSDMHGGDIAIAGAAETDRLGKLPGHSMLALHAEAARNALADAGLTPGTSTGSLSPSHWPSRSDFLEDAGCGLMLAPVIAGRRPGDKRKRA
jgi:hypothetical protein